MDEIPDPLIVSAEVIVSVRVPVHVTFTGQEFALMRASEALRRIAVGKVKEATGFDAHSIGLQQVRVREVE